MTLLGGMGTILGPVVGAGIVVGLQNYLANIGSWSTIATGFIFVICVLAFRRGVVGEIAAHFKNKNLVFVFLYYLVFSVAPRAPHSF